MFLGSSLLHALTNLCLYFLGGMLRFQSGLIVFLAEALLQMNAFLRPWNHHLCERTQSQHRPAIWGLHTFFSFPIVIYRQIVQIGKWTPPKSWILSNWVSGPLHQDFLAIGYILSPMRSLKKRCCHILLVSSALSWTGQWSQLAVMGSLLEFQELTRLS